MAARALPALLLSACVLLAGCAGDPASDPATGPAPSTASATDLAEAAPAPAPEPQPVTVACTITRTMVGTPADAGLNLDAAFLGLDDCFFEPLFDAGLSWAQTGLVETAWTQQPTQTNAKLSVQSDDCHATLPAQPPCAFPVASGTTSPLRIELDAPTLRSLEGQNPQAYVAAEGLVNDLEFTIHITLFPDAIPDGFTAIV